MKSKRQKFEIKSSNKNKKRNGFTVLEVLVSLFILLLSLMTLFNSFSNSIFVLSTTTNLWKAISYAQNELLKSERATISPNVQVVKGEFEFDHPMYGFRWKKTIQDTIPLPKIRVRQINFQLFWEEKNQQYSYDSDIYIKPN